MEDTGYRAIAIVGAGAVLPDAPNVAAFWDNVKRGRYSIREVPPDRWDPELYFDPDHNAPDKTYSKIGGWVREFDWEPMKWRLPLPPRVVEGMDGAQKWAIACTRQALEDYGYPKRTLNLERTAVILGNAMAGEKHYLTSLRVHFPEYARELDESPSFAALSDSIRRDIMRELHKRITMLLPEITEDSMPGELSNCLAGRVANLFNCRGPNFVTDAACASAMAAITAAAEGLIENDFDVAITGGIDRNMGAPTFVKFCKIGALSATGSRPFADGADGFVMGEGSAVFVMKRLADAERDGDRVYAVLRSIAGSSDGKGKGLTAPNPIGQKLAVRRAWEKAGLSPATVSLIEGHGTSTRVGDLVEVESLKEVLAESQLPAGSIALGSVKSNIGHLKGAAGAAGLLKTVLALHEKVLPPSVQCEHPNPEIDFAHSPLRVNTELRPWTVRDGIRRAGLSAFGFGGTNFHAVLEEYVPHGLTGNGKKTVAVREAPPHTGADRGTSLPGAIAPEPRFRTAPNNVAVKPPLRGALVIGAANPQDITARLREVEKEAREGRAPAVAPPRDADLRAPERIAIDYSDAADLAGKCARALMGLAANDSGVWKALRAQGIFRGSGPSPKVAFLYPGQGSQYLNMLRFLRESEPIVADTFAEADRIMTPLLGKPLSEFIFVDCGDEAALAKAEDDLRQTAITQPSVLTVDLALTRMLAAYGIVPEMTMGHSLGEYGALVASGALPFDDALEAVSARGREMTRVSIADKGRMAAVLAPLDDIQKIVQQVQGYLVIANINSNHQAVIGGATKAVEDAIVLFEKAGYNAVPLSVSHAFHTSIVAPASEPLQRMLERLNLAAPRIPVVANVDGEFYPTGDGVVPRMIDILGRQLAAPVQFVKGLQTLYDAGARMFVEVGPKKALQGCADDVLGNHPGVVSLFTNHPKTGEIASFNQALCGLYAAGLGNGLVDQPEPLVIGERPRVAAQIVITGAALGLPGTERIFDDDNVARLLNGEQLIDVVPTKLRRAMLEKNITRLVKSDNGGAVFEHIESAADVIKLAGRGRGFDLQQEFGIPADRAASLDRATQLAIAVGVDALRDAGLPLLMHYKTTTTGSRLPERWILPEELRDETGVIFASAFPGCDSFADEAARFYADRSRREMLSTLQDLRARDTALNPELDRRIADLRRAIAREPYEFDRRFIFRLLSMGHSQFAEYVGARGPNTAVNSACASTTMAVSMAKDWIREGRCRRVIVISADDITTDRLIEWLGAAFLAAGAAATDEVVEEAAVPFDRRRHGMIMGMGAAALVVESAEAARERGTLPICEVVSAAAANSAFHGTRLDMDHIRQVMEQVVADAEASTGISRERMAEKMVFISHETYTPARGGSAGAEIFSLRQVFGAAADRIVIANTKGFTGHAMATGIEDVLAVKSLETGCVPPVANFKEVDPELGRLNLSKGGSYPVEFALRLGAGFGSQIAISLLRWVRPPDGQRSNPHELGYERRVVDAEAWRAWLGRVAETPNPELETVNRTLRVRDRAGARLVTECPKIVPAPTPKTEVSTAPTKAPATDSIREKVLAIVAEKTGYPREMLALDLDLEADLGIDTVKQAEMFAAIREAYGIPRDPNLKLRDFPTLAHVIQFAHDRAGIPLSLEPERVPAQAQDSGGVQDKVLAIVAEKTGYPREMLALDLDLEADLGIDTVKQAEMFAAIREAYGIPRDPNMKLRDFPTLAHVIRFAQERAGVPAASAPAPAAAIGQSGDSIQDKVLAIVADKTGYPREMLALDLDLEADLGIDTVKQAEMFAAIREAYGIPRDPNLKLRDFPTLSHVIQFAHDRAARPAAQSEHPTVAPPAPPVTEGTIEDPIREKVLAIVAEKTGYPVDMLDPALDLEADLGIDTVKQAEMFAAIRDAYGIPRDPTLKLRDFPTLAHVIRFAQERAVTGNPLTEPVVETTMQHPAAAKFEAAARVPRRVPVPVLRPPLTACKSTGVQLGAGSCVSIMPDSGGVAEALTTRLQELGVHVIPIEEAAAGAPVTGIYWLPALDAEGDLLSMTTEAWREATHIRVKSLYSAMRSLYDRIAAPGTFLVSATRLGGLHGYGEAGALNPLGGAVTGFAKAYKRERPESLVKAVDFEETADATEIAELLVEETLRDPGAVEIGCFHEHRFTISLQEQAIPGGPGMLIGKDSVFVITGAAGSIVSAITADLAAASGGTFYLLDVVPEPDPTNPDLARFESDKDGLKRDIFARKQASGERATPAEVEKELASMERAHAALTAIQTVRQAGGTAHYFSVNLTDSDAVSRAIDAVHTAEGRIDVLLHAAGLDRSHSLDKKEPCEFNLVFDVKSDGIFHLLRAIGAMPLGSVVMFSSIAGRFGNSGQTDYSSANDLLCKIASYLRKARPETRAIAIDWTAWQGIGMASRGSIPKIMAMAGITMLSPEAGVPWIRRELTEGDSRGEILVAESLGALASEWDANGGVDTFASVTRAAGLMVGKVSSFDQQGLLTISTALDPKVQPFLFDHKIDDTAVLPGVMHVEALAEAARWPFPAWHIQRFENVNFLAPFKFYRNEPRIVTTETVFRADGDEVIAECRLTGSRVLAGNSEPQVTTHSTARLRLSALAPTPPQPKPPRATGDAIDAAEIYRVYFHGPAYRVMEQAWWDGQCMIGKFAAELPNHHHPDNLLLATSPRLVELCFQTAGLWEMVVRRTMGLPQHFDSLEFYGNPECAGPLMAVVTSSDDGASFDAEVVDEEGICYAALRGYRTVQFRGAPELHFAHTLAV